MDEKETEKDTEQETKKGERPEWAQEIINLLKPKQTTQETTTEIPVPPAPATEEEEELEQEEQQQANPLKKMWDWLM